MNTSKVICEMIKYYKGDIRRINHFMKVYGYAKTIAEGEKIIGRELEIIEVAAIVHDIGIKVSEEKYNSSNGKYQEIEGPMIARQMLEKLAFDKEFVERICYLIGHHHTYNIKRENDYQILIEADFIVNIYEDELGEKEAISIRKKIFKTETGKLILDNLYIK